MKEIKYTEINDKIIKEETITNIIEGILLDPMKENLIKQKEKLQLQIDEIDKELLVIDEFEKDKEK